MKRHGHATAVRLSMTVISALILTHLLSAIPAAAGGVFDSGSARTDTLRVGLIPSRSVVDVGDTLQVEITVLEAGPAFNAYDAVVHFDPEVLTFLGTTPLTDQEGELMTEACASRFHLFTVADDSTTLTVNHSLLCAGVTVTGPGVLYRLAFRCEGGASQTAFSLLDGPGQTRFYDDGLFVTPLVVSGATVQILDPTGAPDDAAPPAIGLRAVPNPFNPRTVFRFELPAQQYASLRVFGVDGRHVTTVVDGVLPRGRHAITWNGRDRHGRAVPSGEYFVLLETGGRSECRPVTLVR